MYSRSRSFQQKRKMLDIFKQNQIFIIFYRYVDMSDYNVNLSNMIVTSKCHLVVLPRFNNKMLCFYLLHDYILTSRHEILQDGITI